MRLSEREAFFRKQNGVVTMGDVAKVRKAREASYLRARQEQEKATQRAAKDAAKGLPLMDLAEFEVQR